MRRTWRLVGGFPHRSSFIAHRSTFGCVALPETPMLTPSTPPYRKRHGRPAKKAKSAPPALVLDSAEFQFVGPGGALTLAFDRAIDLAGFDPSQVIVQDPTGTGFAYAGTGVVDTPGPQTVVVEMGQTTEALGSQEVMSATAAT